MKITQKESPNKFSGRAGWKPDMIVDHITDGSYDGSVAWLCNPASQASAHFVVAQDGRVTQLVPLTDGAWCNGTSTKSTDSRYYGKSTLESVRGRKTSANYYTISIEHEGKWSETKGALTTAQLAATIELHRHIIAQVKRLYGMVLPVDRQHIVGYCEINPVTKPCCPGERFPFDKIIAALQGAEPDTSRITAGSVVRVTAEQYATGGKIPAWVKAATHVVAKVEDGVALLGYPDGINSRVAVSGLELVEDKPGPSSEAPKEAVKAVTLEQAAEILRQAGVERIIL